MRIVDWAEFQKLPENTIFQEIRGNGGYLGDLMILGEVWMHEENRGDFIEAQLLPAFASTNELDEEGLRHMGFSKSEHADFFLTPTGFGRDGMFEYDRRWLVWDEVDRKRLAAWLLDPATAGAQQNDHAHAFVVVPEAKAKP